MIFVISLKLGKKLFGPLNNKIYSVITWTNVFTLRTKYKQLVTNTNTKLNTNKNLNCVNDVHKSLGLCKLEENAH